MEVSVEPSVIRGRVRAPYSKSLGIRTIFYSLLSKVKLSYVPTADDINAAIAAVTALGVKREGNEFVFDSRRDEAEVYVGGSATTLRMLLPIAAALGVKLKVDGDESLRRRPIREFYSFARKYGIELTSDRLPLTMRGKLNAKEVEISGGESSQYISGLMFAFAIVGEGRVKVIPPVSSKSYIFMTADFLNSQGVKVKVGEGWEIDVSRGNPKPYEGEIPGDYALASFYAIAASVTGGEIEVENLYQHGDYFGDHSVVGLLREMGVESELKGNSWFVRGRPEKGIQVNLDDAPDLAVSMAAIAPFSKTPTVMEGVERLRIKESDRISSIIGTVEAFGGRAEYSGGRLIVYPSGLRRGEIECPNDHRIAMMASVFALVVGGTIKKAECVKKSNPNYWEDLEMLGGRVSYG